MDVRLNDVEKACTFTSAENDDRKKELCSAKSDIDKLKNQCKSLEQNTKSFQEKNQKLESKLTDLESRSMRENLLFYGLPEGGEHENCEQLVRQLCVEKLEIQEARNMVLDRVHGVGVASHNKIRPIVAKFHYFRDRETVRQKSYDYAQVLKGANIGIGMQWPQQVRETRKALYPIMQREKSNGKTVKMVRDKLFINGVEYVPQQHQTMEGR